MLAKAGTLRNVAKEGHINMVFSMLEEQAPEGGDSRARELHLAEALIGAAEGGHEQLARELLDEGADPSVGDHSGSTAMHWAVWGGHAETTNLIYDEKGEADGGEDSDNTPAELGLNSPGHEAVIRLLLERGGPDIINVQNDGGCTPLHWVSGAGCGPMIRFLLDMGADVKIRDKGERTPADRARGTGDHITARLLQPH